MINHDLNRYEILYPIPEERINDYYRIRYEVLRKPWNQPENSTKDDTENESIHVLLIDESKKAIGCGRLQFNSKEEGQIRSMAIADGYRNMQLGGKILSFLEDLACNMHLEKIILDARENAVSFYLRNGYKVTGNSYLLFNIIPHFRMEKILKNQS